MKLEENVGYKAEIARLKEKYAGRIRVLCGLERDFLTDDFTEYDYIIGSVHFVAAPDGAIVCVDNTPKDLTDGISAHFGGSVEAYIRAYFRQVREMVSRFDFDIVGHLDLVRKFNVKNPYFDESCDWYAEELLKTADAVAASGKLVEVNTGAISRGWLDDAYPSAAFRDLLRQRGVKFVLSSDAHAADAIDCAFDRFGASEEYVRFK